MSEGGQKRPRCTCGGPYEAVREDFGNRVIGVKCILCGSRLWRDFKVRRPSAVERDTHKERPEPQRKQTAYCNRYVAQ